MTVSVNNDKNFVKPTNAEMLEAISNDVNVSTEISNVIKTVGTDSMTNLYSALTSNMTRKNEFVQSLVNPTFVNLFYSKLYEDKLAYFLNGDLTEGDSIQQIYVQRSLRKGFGEHFDPEHNTVEGDLIARVRPVVTNNIITVNFQHKFKVSIDMRELRKAMLQEYGLYEFVGQLLTANINGANKQEFDDIHGLLDNLEEKTYMVDAYKSQKMPKGVIVQAMEHENKDTIFVEVSKDDPLDLTEKIIQYVGDFEEYSKDFNIVGTTKEEAIETFSNKNDLVLILTNKSKAKMNVRALAQTFNIDIIDLPQRVLSVKKFNNLNLTDYNTTLDTHSNEIQAILMDKDLIQCWDTFKETGQFTNVEGKFYNSFLHHEGIKAICPFCQFVVFHTKIK